MTDARALTGAISDQDRVQIRTMVTMTSLPPRLRERLEMVKAADMGWDVAAIATWSGRGRETVRRWLGTFGAGGVDALGDAPRAGRPCQADAAYLAALERAVTTDPRALGLGVDVWTSGRLSAYLHETTGVRIAPGWLRVLLHRQRFSCGRPKHSVAHLANSGEVTACEETLRAVGEKGAGAAPALRTPLRG